MKKKEHDCKVVQVTNTEEAVNHKEEKPLPACLCTSLCLLVQQVLKLGKTDGT